MANCFDYSSFHPDCDVIIVTAPEGTFLHCQDCRVMAQLEGNSHKIGTADAHKVGKTRLSKLDKAEIKVERSTIGKMSPGVD